MVTYDSLDLLALVWLALMFVGFGLIAIGMHLCQPRRRPMATVRRRSWWRIL